MTRDSNRKHPVAGAPSDVFLIDRADSVPVVGRIKRLFMIILGVLYSLTVIEGRMCGFA